MPLSASAGRVHVTIRGGRKLQRFIERARDPEVLGRIVAKVLRRFLIPALKSRVPRRTGKLSRSLKIVQRGPAIELRGIFYGRFLRIGPSRDTIAELAMDIIASNRAAIIAMIRAEYRREVGV